MSEDGRIPEDVEDLLRELSDCKGEVDQLLPFLYAELHRLAYSLMSNQSKRHTLQPTALVNEAYMKIVGSKSEYREEKLLPLFAKVMRQVLVDDARAKRAEKRRDASKAVPLNEDLPEACVADRHFSPEKILSVHEALDRLAVVDPKRERMVELKFFGGLTFSEIAACVGKSRSHVERQLRAALRWIEMAMDDRK